MSDTIIQECIYCYEETDRIEGVCSECALEKQLEAYENEVEK